MFQPVPGEDGTQAAARQDQRRHQRRPGKVLADQQAQQYAVVAIQPGLALGLGIPPALGREQPRDTSQQGTAEQRRGADQDRQQAQQAAQRVALQEDLAEAVEQGFGPVGAGWVVHLG